MVIKNKMSYQQYLPRDLRSSTPLIVSPRDLFFIKRAEALAAGKSPAEANRIGMAAQTQIFGSPETQRKTFGAPAERRALFKATDVSQLRFTTTKQAFDVARTQVKLANTQGANLPVNQTALNFALSLPREQFTAVKNEFLFSLARSPQAQALYKQTRAEAINMGLSETEAVSLSFAAARQSLGYPLTSQQQALITRLQGQSSPHASQDNSGIGGNGVGGFGGGSIYDSSGSAGIGGGGGGGIFGGFGQEVQQGLSGGLGILLLLGLFAYEATRGGKKR